MGLRSRGGLFERSPALDEQLQQMLKEKQQRKDIIEETKNVATENIQKQKELGQDFFAGEELRRQRQDILADQYERQARENINRNIDEVRGMEGSYQQDLNKAKDVSNQNMTNANKTYEELSPLHREAMESARQNAKSAMTLNDYMDPNNQVAQGVRNLYNTEGQQMAQRYEQQAQNEQRAGQANYGVLSALGAESAAQAMGAMGPMTVGQQMAQMALANQQAGEAYANTQRRMQQLRDMGMSKEDALRTAGIEQGFARTDAAYEAGRLAQEDYARRRSEVEGFDDRNINRRRGISDRLVSLAGEELGSRGRVEGARFGGQTTLDTLARDTALDKIARESGLSQAQMNDLRGILGMETEAQDVYADRLISKMATDQAARAAQQATTGATTASAIQAAGTIGGAALGGPLGAAAGGAITGAMNSATAPSGGTTPTQPTGYTSFQPRNYSLGLSPGTYSPYGQQPNYYQPQQQYGTVPTVNPYPYG